MGSRGSSEYWNKPDLARIDEDIILWLDDPRCKEARLVGGKAAGLAKLASQHNVPPGFAIPRVSAQRSGTMPAILQTAIKSAYQALGEIRDVSDPAVAVRSSALDEDGTETSFAGMHDTYLNIEGLSAVQEAIQKSWSSAVSNRAVAYRRKRGLSVNDIRIAVLIQLLVPADVSGVAFSINPVKDLQDQIVINFSWGLGESIVGGSVTPDTFIVRKSDMAIISDHIGRKLRMTVPVPGGTKEVSVPRFLQEKPSLEESQVHAIAQLTRQLEAEIGAPVDIEFAVADGELFLLQCRPVTT